MNKKSQKDENVIAFVVCAWYTISKKAILLLHYTLNLLKDKS